MLSKQEVFDKSVKGCLDQGDRSTQGSGMCVYRGENGMKCAVGHLIDDSQYNEIMDEHILSVGQLFRNHLSAMTSCGLNHKNHYELMRSLQNVHDGYMADEWHVYFTEVAKDYDLNTEVIDNA